MAKRKSTKKPVKRKAAKRGSSSASELKKKVAELDQKILELCNQRATMAQTLADRETSIESISIHASDRLERLLKTNRGPLNSNTIGAIFRELESGTSSSVSATKVAYLGPEYSYSHLAAIERFGQGCELVPVAAIRAVFEAVDRGDVTFGIVPIENSTDGRIVDTLEMFARLPVRICGELQMRIHHNLLGTGNRSDLREVHSKPQALSQCRDWLAKHLPKARVIPTTSTTAAAEAAAKSAGIGAIASRQAGINYGLSVIAANIEDNKHNITRFAVIALQPADRSGNDKTSLMFELAHQPGALADAMAVFKRNRLNLTWIESFPKQGLENEYLFFVEMEGHQRDLVVRRAVKALEKKTVRIEILGSYAKTIPVG